jgi:hypothetical protein
MRDSLLHLLSFAQAARKIYFRRKMPNIPPILPSVFTNCVRKSALRCIRKKLDVASDEDHDEDNDGDMEE